MSTRPEKYLGDLKTWEQAEAQLQAALNESGKSWELNPGDGAFYGPKIDIAVMDAQRRRHQCATIQLDFQLPIRFNLQYRCPSETQEGGDFVHPVIIHRAILGSLERMIAILTENYGGKWPFWLSPRQVCIVPVSHASDAYAEKIKGALHDAGLYVEADLSDLTFNKKIRNAEISKHSFIFVVGQQEELQQTINARRASPEGKDVTLLVEEAIEQMLALKRQRKNESFLQKLKD